jgi:hypothetical protein
MYNTIRKRSIPLFRLHWTFGKRGGVLPARLQTEPEYVGKALLLTLPSVTCALNFVSVAANIEIRVMHGTTNAVVLDGQSCSVEGSDINEET